MNFLRNGLEKKKEYNKGVSMRRLNWQLLIRTDLETKTFFTEYCKTQGITLHDLLLKIKEML